MIPTSTFWISLAGRLATEAAVVIALAMVLQWLITAPRLRRSLWQAALLGIAMAWTVDISGAHGWALRWRLHPDHVYRLRAKIVNETATVQPESVQIAAGEQEIAPVESGVERPVWWPLQLWLVGVGLFAARAIVLRLSLGLGAVRCPDVTDTALLGRVENLRARIGLRRVRVRAWAGLQSPIAFGTWCPTVALPADFPERFTLAAQDAMLAHELAHLAANDPLWLAIADAVLALSWWHPGTWWARRQLRIASEASADEASALVPGGRVALAESLVALGRELVAPGWARGLGVGVAGGGLRSQLGRRVTALLGSSCEWRGSSPWQAWPTRFVTAALAVAIVELPLPGSEGPSLPTVLAAVRSEPTTPLEIPAAKPLNPVANVDRTAAAEPSKVAEQSATAINQETATAERVQARLKAIVPSEIGFKSVTQAEAVSRLRDDSLQLEMDIQFIEITEGGGDFGLDWLFGQSPTNNPAVQSGPATNLLTGANAPRGQNLRVDLLRNEGQAVVLTAAQFGALQARLKAREGVDILSAPKVVTLADRQAHIEVGEPKNIVVAAHGIPRTATNGASIHYATESIVTGIAADLIIHTNNGGFQLTVLARDTEFLGYDDPKLEKVVAEQPGQKSVTGQVPLPRLRVREVQAVTTTKSGETVALRGPLVEETVRFKDKVVVLGDVPLLGRLFRKEGKTTLHKRLYVFVTTTEITPDGRKK